MADKIIHILGGDSRSRAEQASVVFALGDHHAELYDDVAEMLERPPMSGIILAAETGGAGDVGRLYAQLGAAGITLPLVIASPVVDLEKAVAAIHQGALDYLTLPLSQSGIGRRLHSLFEQAGPYQERRQAKVQAARRIAQLSTRERGVLQLLSSGLTNKEIAMKLMISSRTVEIHRSNMMTKLGARHPADAVKAWLAAA